MTAWEQVVTLNPRFGHAWNSLGLAYFQSKDYRKAITAYGMGLESGYGYPFQAAFNVACCYARLGEKDLALEWLQKSLDLGFRSLQQIQDDENFRSLRGDPRFRKMAAIVDVAKLSRDEGWRFDVNLLVREVQRCHYAPFRTITLAQFAAAANQLSNEVPNLNDNQITVRLQKLLRLAGDGHTSIISRSSSRSTCPSQLLFIRRRSLYH